MIKKLLIVILTITLYLLTFAEDFSGYGILGLSVLDIDDKTETALKFEAEPDFTFGKFETGLSTSFFINEDGLVDINADGEKDMEDVEMRLRYLGWDGEVFKFRYGEMDDFTLGNGSIIYRYSNNKRTSFRIGLHHPDKRYGIDFFTPVNYDISTRKVSDKEKANVVGGRIYIRPFKDSFFLQKAEFSLTGAYDKRDRYNKFYNNGDIMPNGEIVSDENILQYVERTDINGNIVLDENGDAIKDLLEYEGEVRALEASFSFPIIEELIVPYYSYSKIYGEMETGYNTGIVDKVNARGHFTGVMGDIKFFNYKLEMRKISENFVSGYFGRFYETNYNEYISVLMNKNLRDKMTYGVFGEIGVDIFDIVTAEVAYETYRSDKVQPHLYGKLELKPFDKLKGRIVYEQKEIDGFEHKDDFLNENTYIKGEFIFPAIMIGIPGPFILKAEIDQTYHYDEDENRYFPTREYSIGFGMQW